MNEVVAQTPRSSYDATSKGVVAVRGRNRASILLGVVAASLVVISPLHLAGVLGRGEKPPFNALHAGIAEAVIALVLVAALAGMRRGWRHPVEWTIVGNGFAIVGFVVGLSFAIRGGETPDVAYHLVCLPLLVGAFVQLLRVAYCPR